MELNANQQAIYEKLQSQYPKVNKDTIIDYLSGNLSKDDFKSLAIPKVVSGKDYLTQQGYDVDLMKSSIDEIKKDIQQDEKMREFDLESAFVDYKPSAKLLYGASGVRTDKDLPNDIRGALSLSSNNPADIANNAKQLIVNDLIEKYGEDKVNKYRKGIVVQNKEVGLEGYKDQGLIFKIPKELGGDNKFYKANQPGLDTGDFFAISGDTLPIALSIGGGTFGSAAGPAGTIGGSAAGGFIGEYARLQMGRKLYNFNSDMSDEQFNKFALASAGKYAAIDAAATAAFLPLAAAVKQIVLTTPKEKLSADTIKRFLDSGGMDKSIKQPLDKARKDIIDTGVSPKEADDYLAIEIAKAIPRSGIVEKGTVADKLYSKQIRVAETAGNVKAVEDKIMKELTGLNAVDNTTADKIIRNIDQEAKVIRNLELAEASKEAGEAFTKIGKIKNPYFKTGIDSEIDSFNVTFAGGTGKIEKMIGSLSDDIDRISLNNKITVGPQNLQTISTVNKLLKKYERKPFKALKPEDFKKLTKEQQKDYLDKKAVNDMFTTLGEEIGVLGTLNKLKTVQKGLKALKTSNDLNLKDVVQLRTLARAVDENAKPGALQQTVRQLKGELTSIIDDALSANPQAAIKINQFDELLAAKRNSYFKDFAQQFGYGTSPSALKGSQYEGRQIFSKMINPGPEGYKNSMVLGNLLEKTNTFNASSKKRIKAALYEKYLDEVAPTEIGKKGRMTFDQFKETYGPQYKNILGKEYDEFFKTPQKVIDEYDNIIKNTADLQTTFSKALPGIDVNVLDAGAPGQVVKSILELGNKADVGGLVKNLTKQSPEMLTNIRQIFLNNMIKSTRTQNKEFGIAFQGMNGENLNKFLNQNRGTITQLFDEKFFTVHRNLADALELIQGKSGAAAVASPNVTETANKVGLFVDIFAGPLNHKRLVLNRMARIYDGFDLGGDSLAILRDYNLFLNAAKKNFMAGNYPKAIDDAIAGNKTTRNLADKAIDKVNKVITLGLSKDFGRRRAFNLRTNPLFAKEYLKQKLDQQEDIGEPTPFTPVDIVAGKVGKAIGYGGKQVKNLVEGFFKQQKDRRNIEQKREEDIFEKEILEK